MAPKEYLPAYKLPVPVACTCGHNLIEMTTAYHGPIWTMYECPSCGSEHMEIFDETNPRYRDGYPWGETNALIVRTLRLEALERGFVFYRADANWQARKQLKLVKG